MEHDKAKPHVFPNARRPGELLFATLFLAIGLALLGLITHQTAWLPGKGLAAQPRTWPLIGLVGMVVFGALHLSWAHRNTRTPGRWREALLWVSSVEYVAYYLAYVFAVPRIGYLGATIAFCLFLTWRAGYRSMKSYLSAMLFALAVVLLFKTILNVKIPGGAIYEYLPAELRNIMLRYF